MKLQGKLVDALAVLGVGLVTYGVWMLSHPAGIIVGGLVLCGTAAAGARAESVFRGGK
jgi:hypothetical protein